LGKESEDDIFLENSISMGAEGPPPPMFKDIGSTGEISISGSALLLGPPPPPPKSKEIWRVDPPPPLPMPALDSISNPKSLLLSSVIPISIEGPPLATDSIS
jgi:hypothetical protein